MYQDVRIGEGGLLRLTTAMYHPQVHQKTNRDKLAMESMDSMDSIDSMGN